MEDRHCQEGRRKDFGTAQPRATFATALLGSETLSWWWQGGGSWARTATGFRYWPPQPSQAL